MIKTSLRALGLLMGAALPAMAEPPADLNACIKLSSKIAREAAPKVSTEAEYPKFHMKMMDLDSACGLRDFAGAEKIANEIKATYQLP